MTTCRGIVWNMGDEIEEEDIVNYGIGIRGNQQLKVLNARRIYKRIYTGGYASKVKTNGFVITFKGNAIPLEFALYNTINNVSPYKNPVILCKNCYRFGHCANQCRSSSRCQACGETHNEGTQCNKEGEILCINCKGKHAPTSPLCEEFSRQKNINEAMAKHNISFYEANKLFPRQLDKSNLNSQHFPALDTSTPRYIKKHEYISTTKKSRSHSPPISKNKL
ncbi:uncharacterized protein LOC115880031 isoform X1 [Sitophilus oryzae]|uniref:Uncharacterized protein LOC115880031 isoform X1 n=1 Tax=Sitophilus oryzae TaxID=7048 RepID=A0A6J2XPL0_SITOR|nr:uncharacterized protein LOC115880031 isoform X1 [Sitophilus oryzae]